MGALMPCFFFSWNAHLFYLIYLIEVIYLIHVIKLSYLYHVSYVIYVISLVVSDPSNPLNVFYLTIYIRAMAIQSYPFLFDLNYHVLLSQFIQSYVILRRLNLIRFNFIKCHPCYWSYVSAGGWGGLTTFVVNAAAVDTTEKIVTLGLSNISFYYYYLIVSHKRSLISP